MAVQARGPNGNGRKAAAIGALCTLLVVIGLSLWSRAATADLGVVLFVATSGTDAGNDCRSPSNPCRTIQFAVDRAPAESVVKVAAGVYTGTTTVGAVVEITRDVAVKGGYAPGTWDLRDSLLYATVLDGETSRSGAVIRTVTGWPEISGFHITRGAPNVEGSAVRTISGRGIISGNLIYYNGYSADGTPSLERAAVWVQGDNNVIQYNRIYSNAGGGIRLEQTTETDVRENEISDNVALKGGGIHQFLSHSRIVGNLILRNAAIEEGGGVYAHGFFGSLFSANTVMSNTANDGAGVMLKALKYGEVSDNLIVGNFALGATGGLHLESVYYNVGFPVLRNVVTRNSAQSAGGLRLQSGAFSLHSNAIVANQAPNASGMLASSSTPAELVNTTVSGNGGDGVGILASNSSLVMTDTIIAGQSVGVSGTVTGSWQMSGVLWGGNSENYRTSGPPAQPLSGEIFGDPGFAADGYHLTANSIARNRGIGMSGPPDIDRQPRLDNEVPDLGADEYAPNVVAPTPTLWVPAPFPTPTPPSDLMFQIRNPGFEANGVWQTANGEVLYRTQPGSNSSTAAQLGYLFIPLPATRIYQPIYLPLNASLIEVELDVRQSSPHGSVPSIYLVETRSLRSVQILQGGVAPVGQWTTLYSVTNVMTLAGNSVVFEIRGNEFSQVDIDNVWARLVCSSLPTPVPTSVPASTPNPSRPSPTAIATPGRQPTTLYLAGVLPEDLAVPEPTVDPAEIRQAGRLRIGGPRLPRAAACY